MILSPLIFLGVKILLPELVFGYTRKKKKKTLIMGIHEELGRILYMFEMEKIRVHTLGKYISEEYKKIMLAVVETENIFLSKLKCMVKIRKKKPSNLIYYIIAWCRFFNIEFHWYKLYTLDMTSSLYSILT